MKTGSDSNKSYRMALRGSVKNTAVLGSECYPNNSRPLGLPKIIRQKGATLFTALMFLIMLTVLGVNVAQLSVSEERMAGNTRNRDLAFQSASSALKYVELNLASGDNLKGNIPTNPPSTTDGSKIAPGYWNVNVCLPNTAAYWNETGAPDCTSTTTTPVIKKFTWSSTTAASPKHQLQQVASQPMFVVERFPNDASGHEIYRVTAKGVGGDASAVVILQSIIEYY
jgi:type IV pilus assembly protein PilX